MPSLSQKQTLILGLVSLGVILIGVFGYLLFKPKEKIEAVIPTPSIEEKVPEIHDNQVRVIGTSIEGRDIEVYSFGTGKKHLLFVGGVHGGYEWNSTLLSYAFIDYLKANPNYIPSNITIDIIPTLNPDGLYTVTKKVGRFALEDVATDTTILARGRFNARDVDINRNFDCKWKPKSTWQSKIVNAGTNPFSEPEAKALQMFVVNNPPTAAVFWHSKSNAVYASKCHDGILPDTLNIMTLYSQASKYQAFKTFDSYEVTGAADDWLSTINIPAITVELQTRETIEWERNLAGINALIKYYGQASE